MKDLKNYNPQVLVVDDETAQCRILTESLLEWGFHAVSAQDAQQALAFLDKTPFDMVISDVKMPGLSGLELVTRIREKFPTLPVLLVTAFPDIKEAVGAVKDGAIDYLVKPIDLDELHDLVINAVGVQAENHSELPPIPPGFVFESPRMRALLQEAYIVAKSDIPLLLTGESGTGKEVFADLIHAWSPRSQAPFLKLNCAALPESTVESELFGHVRGAFTGAVSSREGRWKAADGGSFMLDEIGELTQPLQAKLLRALQDGSYTPVGSDHAQKADVRIIAATNRNLEDAVQQNTFREDLFYRLNAVELFIPPLRNRKEDIRSLSEHFMADSIGNEGRISPATIHILMEYSWPGNVRQLRNELKRACLMARGGIILPEHLSPKLLSTVSPEVHQNSHEDQEEKPGSHPETTLAEMEKQKIMDTLAECNGNRTRAAEKLGIARRTLIYKLKSYE